MRRKRERERVGEEIDEISTLEILPVVGILWRRIVLPGRGMIRTARNLIIW